MDVNEYAHTLDVRGAFESIASRARSYRGAQVGLCGSFRGNDYELAAQYVTDSLEL